MGGSHRDLHPVLLLRLLTLSLPVSQLRLCLLQVPLADFPECPDLVPLQLEVALLLTLPVQLLPQPDDVLLQLEGHMRHVHTVPGGLWADQLHLNCVLFVNISLFFNHSELSCTQDKTKNWHNN